jgi:hypothetical protein
MDELENFIKNNREALDKYSPPSGAWKMIESGIGIKRHPLLYVFSAAAALVIIFGIGTLIRPVVHNLRNGDRYESIVKNNPQIRETELYYNNVVNDLFLQAKPLLTKHPDLEKELDLDLSQLDSICLEIKKDLKDNISNQEVIEALINNYRIKIQILNEMLDALENEDNGNPNKQDHAL